MRFALLTAALCLAALGAKAAPEAHPAPIETTLAAGAPDGPTATAAVPLPTPRPDPTVVVADKSDDKPDFDYHPDRTPDLSHREVCESLVAAARGRDLPIAFFARLIWHESQFKPKATSPVGAIGIAQFMPATARAMEIDNPFDPREALPASAELLDVLRKRFGNIGLAAAAYNSTPNRIANWLKNKATLPDETQRYVRNITGRSAESWREAKSAGLLPEIPRHVPCTRVDTFVQVAKAERTVAEREHAAKVVLARIEAAREKAAPAKTRQAKASGSVKVAATSSRKAPSAKIAEASARKKKPVQTAERKAVKTNKRGTAAKAGKRAASKAGKRSTKRQRASRRHRVAKR